MLNLKAVFHATVHLTVFVYNHSCRSRNWRQRMTVWRWRIRAAGRAPRPPSHPLLLLHTHTARPRGPGQGFPSTALTSPPASPPVWVRRSCNKQFLVDLCEYALLNVDREGIVSSNKEMTYDVCRIVIVGSLLYQDISNQLMFFQLTLSVMER